MGRCGHNIRRVERGRDDLGRHEPADVRHVRKHVGTVLVTNGANPIVIDETGVCRGTCHDELWSVKLCIFLHCVVVDEASLLHEAVRKRLEVSAHSANFFVGRLVAVRQMSTARQIQRHDAILWLKDRRVRLEVGRGTRERLHVHAPLLRVEVKGLKGPRLAQRLDLVDVLITAVIASTWVSLTIFVRHHRAEGVEDRLGSEVLARDKHERVALAALLVFHEVENLGIGLLQGFVEVKTCHGSLRCCSGSFECHTASRHYCPHSGGCVFT